MKVDGKKTRFLCVIFVKFPERSQKKIPILSNNASNENLAFWLAIAEGLTLESLEKILSDHSSLCPSFRSDKVGSENDRWWQHRQKSGRIIVGPGKEGGRLPTERRSGEAPTGCAHRWRRSSANGATGTLVTAAVLIDVNDGKYAC